jgi:2-phospho-L-lactate guanylyltransferase
MGGQRVARADIWAVVPAKDLDGAKQRLARLLAPEQRRGLAEAMLADVLSSLAAVRHLAGVLVVTRDAQARRLARRHGARILPEAGNNGQTAAVSAAARTLAAEGCAGMLAVPGDVPLVTAGEVTHVLEAHGAAPAVTIVPARDALGSNALACSPPEVMPFGFGHDSFVRHLRAARGQGVEPRVVELPGLGLDIDRPDDLLAFVRRPSATRAYTSLRHAGLAERLQGMPNGTGGEGLLLESSR